MIRIFIAFVFIFSAAVSRAQNFTGQWKGEFIDKSTTAALWGEARCDYVLDLDVQGDIVTGYSYTYFTDAGKKYYTICKLKGIADRKKNKLEVTETERTKTNVPDNITNSFQLHKLTWRKEGDNEILEGNWMAAPGQNKSNIGFGKTSLAKRQLTEISHLAKRINAKKDPASSPERPIVTYKKPVIPVKKNTPIVAKKPVTAIPKTTVKTVIKTPVIPAKDTIQKTSVVKNYPPAEKISPAVFEKRNNAVLQTISVENASVKIELYDNGEVDGDSVSLFYNNRVLLAHKRLTQDAITLELPVETGVENELVMYADNLGTLPPNTALMIVYDGNKRYEVRITSDLKRSGTIRFIHKSSSGN